MNTDYRTPTPAAGYATGPTTKAPPWHGLVAWDLWFNNLTTGLFLVAALGELIRPEVFTAAANTAYPIAFILLFADLVCLVLDLGDPLRFHHMLRVFKPRSPMSLGTWCLTVYSLPLTVIVALELLTATHLLADGSTALVWVHRLAVVVGLAPAFGAAVYKGVLFSTSSQPGWKEARWLGGYLTNSALLLGCAGMLAASLLTGQERAAVLLRPIFGVLLVVNAIPLGLLIAQVRPALDPIGARRQLLGIGVLALGVGSVVPFCLVLVGGLYALLTAVVLLGAGSLMVRFVIVQLPHPSRGGRAAPAARVGKQEESL